MLIQRQTRRIEAQRDKTASECALLRSGMAFSPISKGSAFNRRHTFWT